MSEPCFYSKDCVRICIFIANFALVLLPEGAHLASLSSSIRTMVYKFKIVSDEVSNFSREIEIDPDASFLNLRDAILNSVGYSGDDMSSFFICDEDWSKHQEITLVDMGSASDEDTWLMADTPLSELVDDEGQKLIFVFDYLTERSFFMELRDVITGRSVDEAVCVRSIGQAPPQTTNLDEFERQIDEKASQQAAQVAAADFMDDEFDDEGFDASELPEGFEDFNI